MKPMEEINPKKGLPIKNESVVNNAKHRKKVSNKRIHAKRNKANQNI
jgi:hypothetical protein